MVVMLSAVAVIALGCSGPVTLGVHVTSVTATWLPYNPSTSGGGIPGELVSFTVSGLPVESYLHCNIGVFHSGRKVGATSIVTGAVASPTRSESVSVEVSGDNFAGRPSDAHVVCRANSNPTIGN